MKKNLLRLLIVLTISVTAHFALGMTAFADTAGDFTVTATNGGELTAEDYTYADNVLAIISDTPITISGTTTTDRIEVADGVSAKITLAGINIDLSLTGDEYNIIAGYPALKVADNSTGDVTITLADGTTNILKSGYRCAGLQKNGGVNSGTLTIDGTGTLNATGGGCGAGVGSGNSCECANVVIESGTITATSDENGGAGIGGGYDGDVSNITINGGTVTAEGGWMSAGIGAGVDGSASGIKINGGTINATGGSYGAGIGGGNGTWGATCDDISITGGNITATGGAYGGAGIGGGQASAGTNITIENAVITATASGGGNAIGGGSGYEAADVSSSQNAIIVATTSDTTTATVYGNPVITDDFTLPEGCTLVIPEGSTVTVAEGATFTNNGTVTNNGTLTNNGTIANNGDIVNNGTVEDNGEIIGDQPYSEVGDFTVTGGTKGTDYEYADGVLTIKTATSITIANITPENATTDRIEVAADISASITLNGVNIDLSGTDNACAFKIADDSTGNVTITLADGTTNILKSGKYCAGLQKNGEYSDALGTLIIYGGDLGTGSLTATGGTYGAGIGGGDGGDGSNITINGGTVTVTGGYSGAGIGGGEEGAGTYITINGGTVTTTGSDDGAGIGGGYYGAGSNITISGGVIKATGGNSAAGIGSGVYADADNIVITAGNVTAIGGEFGAGIGTGMSHENTCSNVYIYGGTIIAQGAVSGAGIGGGSGGCAENIVITAGNVTATGGDGAAGIGGGDHKSGNITISGGTITANGGKYGAGIGGGNFADGEIIGISNAIVVATAGEGGNAIGGGFNKTAASLTDTEDSIVIDGTAGTATVYGNPVITDDFTLPDGYTLVIPESSTVTVAEGATFTINGTVTNNGTIVNNGTVINSGTIENKGTITGNAVGGTVNTYDFVITGGTEGEDYTYTGGVLTVIKDGADLTIANKKPSTPTTNRIEVASGVSANITLAGVNIDVSSLSSTAAFKIAYGSSGNVTITLADGTTNTLISGSSCAGLQKNGVNGSLEINGTTGKLIATGGLRSAGIGGSATDPTCCNVFINGGNIIATGGNSGGAGIGGGDSGSGTGIKINGGTVIATGGSSGAGIGGGSYGNGSDIIINGGTVTAIGGSDNSGIGGFRNTGSNIKINGGSVKASSIGCIPTNGTDEVYLLTIANPNSETVTIDGTEYTPIDHTAADPADTNLYVYLPAKTVQAPNEVTVGNETTKYTYDTTNSKWLVVVDAPEADDRDFTYDGEEQTYALAESDYYTISDNTIQTNAGDYIVTVTLNDGYIWSDGETVAKEYPFSIAKAELTVTAESYTVKLGNPLPETLEYTVAGLEGADTKAVLDNANLSFGYENGVTPSALGEYAIVASGDAEIANYTIAYENGKLTITEKDVQTITADDVILTYGDTNGKITAETDGDGAISYKVTTGTDVISVDENGNITILKFGTATVTITAEDTFDYAEATKTVTVTVNKKKIALPSADGTEYTYTGTAQTYGVTSTDDYTVEGGTQTNAGEYPVTITLNNENYEWDGTLGTYTFIIKQAPVTVTAKSYTIKVGEALPTYAYDVTGLVNGETLPITVAISCTADGKTAGTYDIVISGAATSTNYTYSYVNGTLTVTAKAVQTITASDVTLTYGDTDGKITAATDGDGAISYSTTSDVISVAADGTITALKAGPATVTVKAAETDTYAQATKTITVTVNKAAVTVTAKSYAIKVGEALPTYAYDVTGLVNGETLPITVAISCTADGKTAGTYDIIVSGAAASDNYTFSYVKGTLTVSEKEVVAAPTFTPASGTSFTSTQSVTIACATDGATIYYTTDGSTPTTASTKYTGAITITSTTTIKAIAVKDGMTDSAVVTATYTKKSSGGGGGGGGYTPSRPSTPSNPEIGGKSASWATIADEISKLPVGSEVTIELNGNYDVPVDVIKQIAENDIKVTFIVDSTRSWYVDGAKIETPTAADLTILYIGSLKADGVRGDVGTKFRIDGTNIPTELIVALDKKHAGKFANLYRKDGDKLVFVDNAKIDADGNAMLSVSEKGDYVVMVCEFSDRKGDVSNDGVTNALDASAILKDIVELEDAANPEMLDYNGDGKVNALDASAILIDIVNDKI